MILLHFLLLLACDYVFLVLFLYSAFFSSIERGLSDDWLMGG